MNRIILAALFMSLFNLISLNTNAQANNYMYRIAKIKIDAKQLEQYKVALKEQMNAAIKLEPGVLSYTVVADKKDSSLITIMEVYANLEAYQSHIITAHFKKYKETVKDMVLSLELFDTELVASLQKKGFSIYSSIVAQSPNERKVANTEKTLFNKIAQLDSSLFTAYNSKNLDLMKTYFTKDLEWYQDNGGLIGFEKVFKNFESIFNRDYDLKRNLINESLEVHPIEGYGAIEIGKHQFKHIENGKLEIGTFKFLMIWKNDNGKWKISRVISYDH